MSYNYQTHSRSGRRRPTAPADRYPGGELHVEAELDRIPAPINVLLLFGRPRTVDWVISQSRRRLFSSLRRATYPLTAFPVDLGCVALLLVRTTRRPGARLIDGVAEPDPAVPWGTRTSVGTRSLLVRLPLDAVVFVVAAYIWLLLPVNWAFPLRPDTDPSSLRTAWGGPTLAGAWTVHAVGATLVFLVVGLPLLNGLAWVQDRFTGTRGTSTSDRGSATR